MGKYLTADQTPDGIKTIAPSGAASSQLLRVRPVVGMGLLELACVMLKFGVALLERIGFDGRIHVSLSLDGQSSHDSDYYMGSQYEWRLACASLSRTQPGEPGMSVDYTQYCPVGRTLDIIGDRWTLLILRDLMLDGPRRFHDLQASLSRISPNTLSARLKALEAHGIVERRLYADHPPRAEYVLTAKGNELRPVLRSLRTWGEKHTTVPPAPGASP
jgi:DNA-binding HxlR family transcriptional regulator